MLARLTLFQSTSKKPADTFPLQDLPVELIKEVLDKLDHQSLIQFSKTNRFFHDLIQSSLNQNNELMNFIDIYTEVKNTFYKKNLSSLYLRFSSKNELIKIALPIAVMLGMMLSFYVYIFPFLLSFIDRDSQPFLYGTVLRMGILLIAVAGVLPLVLVDRVTPFEESRQHLPELVTEIKERVEQHSLVPGKTSKFI